MSALSHRTAIARRQPSAPARIFAELAKASATLLDYGCGRGMDADWLESLDFQVDRFDPHWFPRDISSKTYDHVLCSYVLNVIEDPEERQKVIANLRKLRKISAYVTVRSDSSSVGESWVSRGDGFITSTGTFQKFYTVESLRAEFGKVDVVKSSSDFIMFRV